MAFGQWTTGRSSPSLSFRGPTGRVVGLSSTAKIGDSCWIEGWPIRGAEFSTVIVVNGQSCTFTTRCDGVCHNGAYVATRCDKGQISDCKPIEPNQPVPDHLDIR